MKSFSANCKFPKMMLRPAENLSAVMIFKYSILGKGSIGLCYVLWLLTLQCAGSAGRPGIAKHPHHGAAKSKHWALKTYERNVIPFRRLKLSQGRQNLPSQILFWKTIQPGASWCSIEIIYSAESNARAKPRNNTQETENLSPRYETSTECFRARCRRC